MTQQSSRLSSVLGTAAANAWTALAGSCSAVVAFALGVRPQTYRPEAYYMRGPGPNGGRSMRSCAIVCVDLSGGRSFGRGVAPARGNAATRWRTRTDLDLKAGSFQHGLQPSAACPFMGVDPHHQDR